MQPEAHTRRSPRMAGLENRNRPGRHSNSTTSTDPVELVLSRLDRVRKCGRGHIACCPAHEDRSASLSITGGEDGRVLLHCFAGCGAADIVAALGLEIGDLFIRRPTANMTHAERSALRERGRQAQWKAALAVLDLEATVIQIAAGQVLKNEPLNAEDFERVVLASNRITDARSVLNAR